MQTKVSKWITAAKAKWSAQKKKPGMLLSIVFGVIVLGASPIMAQAVGGLDIGAASFLDSGNFSETINLLITLSSIGLIPFFLMSVTSFLRVVIVLSMIRQAIGTQQAPPNPVILSLALFVTIFIMTPVYNTVHQNAIVPYQEGRISQSEAMTQAITPLRTFMLKMTRDKDLALFIEFSQVKNITNYEEVPIFVLVPAFMISELKSAFQIGFLLFIPFVVIDLIISNVLLSLGMFMLSPAMISLPFKILIFVLTDGWNLIIRGLITSFNA